MKLRVVSFALAAALAAAAGEAPCHQPDGADPAAATSSIAIPRASVVDQDGRRVEFADLVKDRVVAVNFIFTTCTTICPPLGATFGRLRKELGARAGSEVLLLSISLDPVVDTPGRLKEWAAKFGAGPGWTLLTGDRPEVDRILNALGGAVGPKEDHSPAVLVGNPRTGRWLRGSGLGPAATLLSMIDRVGGL